MLADNTKHVAFKRTNACMHPSWSRCLLFTRQVISRAKRTEKVVISTGLCGAVMENKALKPGHFGYYKTSLRPWIIGIISTKDIWLGHRKLLWRNWLYNSMQQSNAEVVGLSLTWSTVIWLCLLNVFTRKVLSPAESQVMSFLTLATFKRTNHLSWSRQVSSQVLGFKLRVSGAFTS